MRDHPPDVSKGNILIVDDVPANLRILTEILSGRGYLVRPVRSGARALLSAQAEPPDLILLDIKMPKISGYQVCEQLKADERMRDVPIIFISALHEVIDKLKAFALGGVDYITKPFQPEEVVARVETHLALHKLQKQLQENNQQLRQEIAERQRVEEDLRKLSRAVEQNANAIMITDLAGTIEFVNPVFSEITGYSAEEVLGHTPRLLKSGKHPAEFYRHLWATIRRGEVWQGELINKKKTGELYWELTRISPIKDREGHITHYVAVKDDITQRKQTEDALQQMNRQLQETNASKDKFFSIIAHDLRNPLAGLLGVTETIIAYLDDFSKKEISLAIRELKTSVEIVYALLENLLSWARFQQGLMIYAPIRLAVADIAANNICLFASNARQKQITVANLIPKNTLAYADQYMIDTVMRNLISNALKFTYAGGRIEILARQSEATVEIAVADTGIGIRTEDLTKLFRLDVKHTNPGTTGETGTGLGLLLCKELVEKNGGAIRVNSQVGAGTVFSFTLPNWETVRDSK